MKRDIKNGMIFGVCAGIANHLNVDTSIVRLVVAASFFLTGSITFWAYLVAAIILPKE